jgi:hypothetical protein
LADATFYARRVDAEAVHLDDDAAWRVVLRPLPDGGEAVHTGQLRDESVSSSGSVRDEAALPEAVGEAGAMPGSNGGFTMAAFKASDVPEGTKLYAAPPPPPVELPGDVVREAIIAAYLAGAQAVHDAWSTDPFPEFEEAAHDYAASIASRAPSETGEGR